MHSVDGHIPTPSWLPGSPEARPAPSAAAQEACLNPANQPEAQPPRSVRRPEEILEDPAAVACGQIATKETVIEASEELSDAERAAAEVVVQHRRAGSIEITAVLGRHEPEHAPVIADALADCDVIAMEIFGYRSEEIRRAFEAGYTGLISSAADPEWVSKEFGKRRATGSHAANVLYHLRGTDKKVVFLDIAEDHPRSPIVSEAEQIEEMYTKTVRELEPLEEARAAALRTAKARAESLRVRDEVMTDQLEVLVGDLNRSAPGTSVGVALGGGHHEVVAAIGEETPAGAGKHEEVVRRYNQDTPGLLTYNRAMFAAKGDNPEQATAYADRALVVQYLTILTVPTEMHRAREPIFSDAAEIVVRGFSTAEVEDVLKGIKVALADQTESHYSRSIKLKAALRPNIAAINRL
jgi:nucleotide-binding universal stress UspA family protein